MGKATLKQVAKDGVPETKENTRLELGKTAYEVAGATYAFAAETGNTALAGRVDYGRREVLSGSQAAIQARCTGILNAATEVQGMLDEYGATPALLELLNTRIGAFELAQTQPREKQASNTAAGHGLETSLRRASRVLNGQLDRLVVQFEETAPEFVDEYRSARRIVNLRGSTAAKSPVEPEKQGAKSTPTAPSDATGLKVA